MAGWVLVRPLVQLTDQLNEIAPGRDKASDGSIGDYAHSTGKSGHNPDDTSKNNAEWDGDSDNISEVRAKDLDKDLRTPGLTMLMICAWLVKGARSGRFWWIRYIIFDGVIYHKNTGFAARTYTGSNKHEHHMHVSTDWNQASDNADADYAFWEMIGTMEADLSESAKQFIRDVTADAGEVWAAQVNPGDGRRGLGAVVVDLYTTAQGIKLAQISQTQTILTAISAMPGVDTAALAELLGPQIVAGIVAALPDMDGASPDEVEQRVIAGVRTVLGGLDNT
jgi:hypothetical protein